MDYDGRDEMTSFAIKIQDADLPDFASDDQELRNLEESKTGNSNLTEYAIR